MNGRSGPETNLPRFFATFGIGHTYSGSFVEIFAEDSHAARACMIKSHGTEWSQEVYRASEFKPQIKRYGLRRLATVRQKIGERNRDGSLMFVADRRN